MTNDSFTSNWLYSYSESTKDKYDMSTKKKKERKHFKRKYLFI